MLKKITVFAGLLLIAMLLTQCGCDKTAGKQAQEQKKEKAAKLARLQEEEKQLIEELKQVVCIRDWPFVNARSVESARTSLQQVKEWLEGTNNTIRALYQTQSNVAEFSPLTRETLRDILQRVRGYGLKAGNRNEAIASLKKWRALLENLRDQQELEIQIARLGTDQ